MSRCEILLVDDDVRQLNSLHQLLTTLGYSVTMLSKPTDAVQLMQQKHFSVLISDVMMQPLDGISLMKTARDISPDTGVILQTASLLEDDVMKRGEGFEFLYIQKPFVIQDLVSKLDSLIAKHGKVDKQIQPVLLIDDDWRLGNSLKELIELKAPEFKISLAKTCAEGLKKFSEDTSVEVVIVDYSLPDGNGIDLGGKLRELNPDVYVILLTGHTTFDIALEAMKSQINYFVTKSADHEDLLKALNIASQTVKLKKERRELIKMLHLRNDELSRTLQLKESWVSIVNHDLRLPMTSISGYSEMMGEALSGLRDHPRVLELKELMKSMKCYMDFDMMLNAVEQVRSGCWRMTNMINDILDSGMMESGKFKISPKEESFVQLVNTAYKNFSLVAKKQKNIDMVCEVPKEDVVVMMDSNRVLQCIGNFISNAIKFTPNDGKITISGGVEKNFVYVRVKDSGPGLEKEDCDRVFQRYFQVMKSITKRERGLGLGLWIGKAIIDQHGGQIWAESEGVGKGATFSFTLPYEIEGRSNNGNSEKI